MKPWYYWPRTASRAIVITKPYNTKRWATSTFLNLVDFLNASNDLMGPYEVIDRTLWAPSGSVALIYWFQISSADDHYFWLGV